MLRNQTFIFTFTRICNTVSTPETHCIMGHWKQDYSHLFLLRKHNALWDFVNRTVPTIHMYQ